jgi:multidrug efflux pump subunit AcrA (membrane-fusion protein)
VASVGGLLHRGAQQQQQQQQQQQRTTAEQQQALLQQQQMALQQQQRMAGLAQLQMQQQQMQAGGPLRAGLPGQVMPTAVAGLGLDSRGTQIDFADLELWRVIGTGQFGLVRVVRHVKTDEVFALKVRRSW